jgi:hypothetical protein
MMSAPVMRKVDLSVGALVDMIARGELRLPEMQRQYVWRATRVRDLLDSLYRGYPSGAILVWETDEAQPLRNLAVPQDTAVFATSKLLLDGQQRLTSLAAVLRGHPIAVRGRRRPIEILFNLEHADSLDSAAEVDSDEPDDDPETDDLTGDDENSESLADRLQRQTFVVASRALAALPNWVSVTRVMTSTSDAEFLQAAGITSFDDPRFGKYTRRLRNLREIRSYPYVMHLLDRSLSYEEVAAVFVRVNSLGVKLRSSDLALAEITARWQNFLPLLEGFQSDAADAGFSLDAGLLVRATVVFASGQSRFKTVRSTSVEKLKAGWEAAQRSLRFGMDFLRANGRIEDASLLSSPFFLIVIAYFFHQRDGAIDHGDERRLLEWVLVGSARGYFSGSPETKLDADLARIRSGEGPTALLETLEQQFGRLRFNVGDIAGKTPASGLFALIYLALQRRGATDWRSGLSISVRHRAHQQLLQWHHIFPKARLKHSFSRRQVNEIANMAFIGGDTNRRISAALPEDYLPKILAQRGAAALEAQCVPLDPDLWQLSSYERFIDARRSSLIVAVNEMLDALSAPPQAAAVPRVPAGAAEQPE